MRTAQGGSQGVGGTAHAEAAAGPGELTWGARAGVPRGPAVRVPAAQQPHGHRLLARGKYRVDIHERFLAGVDPETKAGLTFSRRCGQAAVDARGAHRLLQRRNVGKLMKAIREVARREELTCGRSSPANDPPPAWVSAAGRQVTDHHVHRRLDLLGLRRLEERARAGSWS